MKHWHSLLVDRLGMASYQHSADFTGRWMLLVKAALDKPVNGRSVAY